MAKLFTKATISSEVRILNQVKNCSEPVVNTLALNPLKEEAAIDLEELRSQAYQKGYQAAQEEATQSAETELNLLKQQLEKLLSSIPQALEENRLHNQSETADILLLIVQQLFIEQQHSHESLELRVQHILMHINNSATTELHLHPQDIHALKQGFIKIDTAQTQKLTIKADESLRLGGCRVATEHGLFDASIEKQIDNLKELLLQMKQGGHHAGLE